MYPDVPRVVAIDVHLVEHASPLAGGIYYCGTTNSTTVFDQAVPRGRGACVGHQHLRHIENPFHA